MNDWFLAASLLAIFAIRNTKKHFFIRLKSMSSKTTFFFLSLLLITTLFAYYSNVSDDYDVWWHLKYGEYFVQNHTWKPDHTAYSWTPTDGRWTYVTWIASSILYLTYKAGNFIGLTILQWFLLAGIAIEYIGFIKATGRSITLTGLACLLLTGTALNPIAVYIKPELFSLLFFATTVLVYFVAKLKKKPCFFIIYPPLFLIWINTHGGFLNGLVFISLALATETLCRLFKKSDLSPRWLMGLTIAVILSYLAMLVNPYGLEYPIQLWRAVTGDTTDYHTVSAYLPLYDYLFSNKLVFRMINTAWIVLIMEITFLCLVGYGWVKYRVVDLPVLAMNLIFFVYGFSIFRTSIFFCLLWLFSWSYLVIRFPCQTNPRLKLWPPAIIVTLSAFVLFEVITLNTEDSWGGSRIEEGIPLAETRFITANQLPRPLFNDYLIGGYLIWAMPSDYKVFIDPRYVPYRETGVFRDYMRLVNSKKPETLQQFEHKYPFNTAILHVDNCIKLVERFLDSPDWTLVYFDKVAAVFVRKSLAKNINLPKKAGDMSPEKFKNVTNPAILFRVFYLYCNYDFVSAAIIRDIYQSNVRRYYLGRKYHLSRMHDMLSSAKKHP